MSCNAPLKRARGPLKKLGGVKIFFTLDVIYFTRPSMSTGVMAQ